jgi:membrane protein required for colicin V production
MAGLTALDILVLLALAGGFITGSMRGFVQEALSLAALIVALFAVRLFHEPVTMWLYEIVGTEAGAGILAFALIMGVIWGGGKYAAARIGGVTRKSLVGPVDRILGAGFGTLKALLIVTALFMVVTLANDTLFGADSGRPEWMTDSRTYPLLSATGSALSDVVAERLDDEPEPS